MGKVNWYQARGFYLLNGIDQSGLIPYFAATVNIYKGDALKSDGSGYATNGSFTAFSNLFLGVAAEPFDNATAYTDGLPSHGDDTASTNSTKFTSQNLIRVIPPLAKHHFIVPVATTLITQAAVGLSVDLDGSTAYKVLVSDTTGAASSYLFHIDEIDVSAAAIVANTYGYAIGHFVSVSA